MLALAADSAMASTTAQVRAGTLEVRGDAGSDKLLLRLLPNVSDLIQPIVDLGTGE